MTCISHQHRFADIHIYKAGGTAVTDLLLPHARLRERVASHPIGRKLFYAVNIAQECASGAGRVMGTSSGEPDYDTQPGVTPGWVRLRILTLATCHNRKACTLSALADLHAQELPADVALAHVIVDDGSTDGTGAAVRDTFPAVTVIKGDGTLFWAGGMRFGWERHARHQAFDYLFVYNDDSRFEPTALADLIAAAPGPGTPTVVVGSFRDPEGRSTTYGARRRCSRWHPLKFGELVEPNGTVQEAETLNMNGALISREALERVGFLSEYFVHGNADFEYGLKLRKAGGRVLVAPRHIGRCAMNPASMVTPLDAPDLRAALKMLFDPKREPFAQRLGLYRRHGGWFWPLFWVTPYLTIWLHPLRRRRGTEKPS